MFSGLLLVDAVAAAAAAAAAARHSGGPKLYTWPFSRDIPKPYLKGPCTQIVTVDTLALE